MVPAHPSIHAVVFDLDGLLLDTERMYLDTFRRTRTALGLALPDDAYLRWIGLPLPELRARLGRDLRSGTGAEAFLAAWSREIAVAFEDPAPVKPGVAELCAHLRAEGIALAVATSSQTERAAERLDASGLLQAFPVIVGGDQVARGKPAPDVYREAMRRMGAAPDRTAAFEDSDVGVRAALAAGAVTVQVPDLVQPADAVRRLGHLIVPDILTGARSLGLI